MLDKTDERKRRVRCVTCRRLVQRENAGWDDVYRVYECHKCHREFYFGRLRER